MAKINKLAPLERASIIGCAVITGYGSAINVASVHEGSTCAIWGLGAIGLCVALGCKAAGAKRIIGVDNNPAKFEIAKRFGCNEFINPLGLNGKEIAGTFLKQGGLDYAFECVGSVKTLEAALSSLSPWGTLVIVGLPPKATKLSFSVGKLLAGQRIIGSCVGGYKSRAGVQQLTEKYVSGELAVIDHLITHQFKLDQINEAFEHLKSGKSIRSVILF